MLTFFTVYGLEMTERGFNVTCTIGDEQTVVRVLITTIGRNFRLISSSIHLDMKYLQSHLAAIRHRLFDLIFNKSFLYSYQLIN